MRKYTVPIFSEVKRAIESGESIGFCVLCGEEHYGIEPDACKYRCESCGRSAVYGAEQILFMGMYSE